MKKLFFMFTLLGLFALSVPKDATAQDTGDGPDIYPGTFNICGNTCLCWDQEDMDFYTTQYC